MEGNMNSHKERFFLITGLVFVFIGFICNEWVLSKLFSPDGKLLTITRFKILNHQTGMKVIAGGIRHPFSIG